MLYSHRESSKEPNQYFVNLHFTVQLLERHYITCDLLEYLRSEILPCVKLIEYKLLQECATCKREHDIIMAERMKSCFAHSNVFKVTFQICAINKLSTKFATAEVRKVTRHKAKVGIILPCM